MEKQSRVQIPPSNKKTGDCQAGQESSPLCTWVGKISQGSVGGFTLFR